MELVYESDLSPKEKRKRNWDTIRSLRGKKRLEYLWAYYRFVIVIVLAVLFAVCTIGTMVRNMSQNPVLSIVIVDAVQDDSESDENLEESIRNYIGAEGKHDQVQIDTSVSSADTDENTAKLTVAMSSVSDNDVIICNQTVYDKFKEAGAFKDPKEVLGDTYSEFVPYMTNGVIDISKCPGWTEEMLTYSPAYVCVLNSSPHEEQAAVFMEYLLDGAL